MSRAWTLVRGGLPAGSLGTERPHRDDPRLRRRHAARPAPPWVSAATRAEVRARLERGEPVEAIAGCLGLQIATVQFLAIERDRAPRLLRGA